MNKLSQIFFLHQKFFFGPEIFFLQNCNFGIQMSLNIEAKSRYSGINENFHWNQCCPLYTWVHMCLCTHKHMCTQTHCVHMCTHEYSWVKHIDPKFSFVVNNKSIKEINTNSITTTISLVYTTHVYTNTCVHGTALLWTISQKNFGASAKCRPQRAKCQNFI